MRMYVAVQMELPPHTGGGESMHFKLQLGIERGQLKPVIVFHNGTVDNVTLMGRNYPSNEASVQVPESIQLEPPDADDH